jgi:exosortase
MLLTFAVVSLAVASAFWSPLWKVLSLALARDEYTHILIIVPLSGALIFIDRRSIFAKMDRALLPGLGLAIVAVGLLLMGRVAPLSELTLQVAALVTAWLATFVLCFGIQAFRRALFPLLFCFLMVPLPRSVLHEFIALLQKGSAFVAFHLLRQVGIPVARDGLVLFLPGLNIEVAAECSGIRSSLVLFVTSLVMAHLLLREGWKKLVVAMLVVPVTILKNGIRIFVLSSWAVSVDPGILSSWVHYSGGVIFFLLGLGLMMLSIWLLQRIGSRPLSTNTTVALPVGLPRKTALSHVRR